MFDKLKNALNSAVKSLGEKEITEKDLDQVLSELEIKLLESDVATEVVDSLKSDLTDKLLGKKVEKSEVEYIIKESLRYIIFEMFDSATKINLLEEIKSKTSHGHPYVISFVGINGTGKTTTLAKVARLLQKNKFSVVVAASDTYRAGAIEQLKEHANKLGVKIVSQKYGADPAAVARDAFLYAKSHRVDCVLIDTAGRMQTSVNLMEQISKIHKVVQPDLKLFVGDSLAGNDTVSQAREFFNYIKFDGIILTKSDADAKGGAAVSTVKVSGVPILYLGVGQSHDDLQEFDVDTFLDSIFGKDYGKALQLQTESTDGQIEDVAKSTKPSSESEKEFQMQQQEETISKQTAESTVAQEDVTQTTASKTQEGYTYTKEEDGRDTAISCDKGSDFSSISAKSEYKETQNIGQEEHSDPFESIKTQDIEAFRELFDIEQPENDSEERQLANRIKKWIQDGRPKTQAQEFQPNQEKDTPDTSKKDYNNSSIATGEIDNGSADEDRSSAYKEEEKTKKKRRWFFGWKKN